MSEIRHQTHAANGIRLHVAECGEGPVVLFVHGFPESWYSWRHQLPAVAAAGYRAVAMDVRGYGRSSKPREVADYRMIHKVEDVVALCDCLTDAPVTLVGHDWGAPIVWNSALLRPDRFRAVAGLSVPYNPPSGRTAPIPTEAMRANFGPDAEFYVDYFQQVGRAEAEIEPDVRGWLWGFYWGISGGPEAQPTVGLIPKGTRMRDKFVYPDSMPDWMTEADLDTYTAEFEYSGFFGPLSRYRNVDRDQRDLGPWAGRPIEMPSLFVGGSRDGPTIWGQAAIDQFPRTLPGLTRSEILAGVGHWIQQEAPERTNELLLEFLATVHG